SKTVLVSSGWLWIVHKVILGIVHLLSNMPSRYVRSRNQPNLLLVRKPSQLDVFVGLEAFQKSIPAQFHVCYNPGPNDDYW
ncbi:MAG: hypothetical protein ACK5N9_08770, partial [Pirellula sp.]